jgi:hypothetical protein
MVRVSNLMLLRGAELIRERHTATPHQHRIRLDRRDAERVDWLRLYLL